MALVALGVTGGIGAYKAVEVARGLQKHGHDVQAVMTKNARRFIGPLTFEAITRRRVITGQFAPGLNADVEPHPGGFAPPDPPAPSLAGTPAPRSAPASRRVNDAARAIGHIDLASTIDLLLVAPATANVIGKFAHGIADDFLSALYLATRAPTLVAPAMNTLMWEHPAVRANVEALAARGVRFVDPEEGYLACGWVGRGRLAEPPAIVEAADRLLRRRSTLAGRRVLVTAGPTVEDLDPVRFIGNRSSGRMGFALAGEAQARGAEVVLVAGPTTLDPPQVARIIRVRSAQQMHDAVMAEWRGLDAVVMAAAVADYTPAGGAAARKIEKGEPLTVTLERTPDILAALGARRGDSPRPALVGFAAETGDPVARASAKRSSKRVDLIVANDVTAEGSGFEVPTNQVTLVSEEGAEPLPLMSKTEVASAVMDRIEQLLQRQPAAAGR